MELLNADITKFQALYKAHVGVELDYQTAREELAKLVRQVEIVHRPLEAEKGKKNENRVEELEDKKH